jgi:uncharacterized protein YndB with AHSA1/START domain
MSDSHEVRAVEALVEVRIEATREEVWDAVTRRASEWWHRDFYTGKEPLGFVVEPRLGGRVYEDWGEGDGALWYSVVALRRGESLTLAGTVACGPTGLETILDTITLTDDGGVTLLRLHSRAMGRLGDDFAAQTEAGWNLLLGKCLKDFVERGERPARPASVRPPGS